MNRKALLIPLMLLFAVTLVPFTSAHTTGTYTAWALRSTAQTITLDSEYENYTVSYTLGTLHNDTTLVTTDAWFETYLLDDGDDGMYVALYYFTNATGWRMGYAVATDSAAGTVTVVDLDAKPATVTVSYDENIFKIYNGTTCLYTNNAASLNPLVTVSSGLNDADGQMSGTVFVQVQSYRDISAGTVGMVGVLAVFIAVVPVVVILKIVKRF